MKRSFTIFMIFLSGCSSFKLIETGNSPTRVQSLPVKAALKDSSVNLGFPLRVEKKPTGGVRSTVDLKVEIILTEPDGIDIPLVPNGITIGLKNRW
jgi:hypothetical protein